MYCKLLKLTNGEDIIARTDDICDTLNGKEFIEVEDAVLIMSMRIPRGSIIIETYSIQPWIKMVKTSTIRIPTKSIIVAVDIHEMAEKQYYQYLKDYKTQSTFSSDNNFETNNEEEAEDEDDEDLEDFLQTLSDDSEEEDDGPPRNKFGRTIH